MFGVNKERLAAALDKLQKYTCSYGGGSFCDCKYNNGGEIQPMSETNCGCPELRMAVLLVQTMSEEEFKMLCDKAGVSL